MAIGTQISVKNRPFKNRLYFFLLLWEISICIRYSRILIAQYMRLSNISSFEGLYACACQTAKARLKKVIQAGEYRDIASTRTRQLNIARVHLILDRSVCCDTTPLISSFILTIQRTWGIFRIIVGAKAIILFLVCLHYNIIIMLSEIYIMFTLMRHGNCTCSVYW